MPILHKLSALPIPHCLSCDRCSVGIGSINTSRDFTVATTPHSAVECVLNLLNRPRRILGFADTASITMYPPTSRHLESRGWLPCFTPYVPDQDGKLLKLSSVRTDRVKKELAIGFLESQAVPERSLS